MYNPAIYVFLNKSLHMSVGKASAQTAHAVAMSFVRHNPDVYCGKWIASPHRTVIVLEARDEEHMRNIRDYLAERDIQCEMTIDEGVNEIDPHTLTAMATWIVDKDSEKTQLAMSTFNLYKDLVNINVGFEK